MSVDRAGRPTSSFDRLVSRPHHNRDLNCASRTVDRTLTEAGSCSRSTARSTELLLCTSCVCRSTGRSTVLLLRSTGQSTGIACARWCTPVDRYLLSVMSSSLATSTSISLPTILHLGEDFLNLSRTQHRICRLESGCTSVVAYVPCPRDQTIRSYPKELQQAHAT